MKSSIFIVITLLCSTLVYSQPNPFRTPVRDTISKQSEQSPQRKQFHFNNAIWEYVPFNRNVLSFQRCLIGKLSHLLRKIARQPDPLTVIGLLLMAFLYGIVHSLGPGHAKVLFMSHGLARKTPLHTTWIAGTVFSATHTGSAILLYVIVRMILGLGQNQSDDYSSAFVTLSGILIIIAGLMIIAASFLEKTAHTAAGSLLHKSTSLTLVAVIAGLAPCPGAFLIMTFSNIIGIVPIGIAAVIALSIGMAITVSIAGCFGTVLSATLSRTSKQRRWRILVKSVRYAGGILIMVIGLLVVIN